MFNAIALQILKKSMKGNKMVTKTEHKPLYDFKNLFHNHHTMLCSVQQHFTEYFSQFFDMIKQVVLNLFPLL